jgi:hypothetical protein
MLIWRMIFKIQYNFPTFPTRSTRESESLEGEITLAEASNTLSNMKSKTRHKDLMVFLQNFLSVFGNYVYVVH